MSMLMHEEIKCWTTRRKTPLVLEILQGKTTLAEASRSHDVSPSKIQTWVDDAKKGIENALRANPLDVREQYERQLKEHQEAYGKAMLASRVRARKQVTAPFRQKSCSPCWTRKGSDRDHPIRRW